MKAKVKRLVLTAGDASPPAVRERVARDRELVRQRLAAMAGLALGLSPSKLDAEVISHGLIEPAATWRYFVGIEPQLYRYPAIDPPSFRRAVEELFGPEPAGK